MKVVDLKSQECIGDIQVKQVKDFMETYPGMCEYDTRLITRFSTQESHLTLSFVSGFLEVLESKPGVPTAVYWSTQEKSVLYVVDIPPIGSGSVKRIELPRSKTF